MMIRTKVRYLFMVSARHWQERGVLFSWSPIRTSSTYNIRSDYYEWKVSKFSKELYTIQFKFPKRTWYGDFSFKCFPWKAHSMMDLATLRLRLSFARHWTVIQSHIFLIYRKGHNIKCVINYVIWYFVRNTQGDVFYLCDEWVSIN